MRTFLLAFLFLITLTFTCLSWAVEDGEKIHYNVTQMGFKAGEATLSFIGKTQYQNQETIYIDFYSKGMNFEDQEKIYLDPQRLKPLFVERNLNIFGKKEKILEEYSENHLKITKTAGGKTTELVIDKKGWVDNIYAFIYRYRQSEKDQSQKEFDIELPTKNLKIAIVRKDSMTIGNKKYEVLFMQSKPAKYKIWFDASQEKLPLRISGAVGLGNTVMVMTEYEKK